MENLTQSTIAFIQEHGRWGPPIVFALAFCKSFAFVSLLVPATGILLGVGGLIAAAGLHFWSIWLAAALGAIAGDWLAYSLAFHFKDRVTRVWPFSSLPGTPRRWCQILQALGRYRGIQWPILRPFSCNCADRGRALCHAVVLLSGCEFCISRTVGGWHFDTGIFEHPLAGGLNPGNSRVHAFSRSNLCGADVCPADGVARSDGW